MDEVMLKNIIDNYETPIYVFNINIVKDRISYLRKSLPSNVNLCYAIKANTFIVKDIENYIDRFEVCSPGEYYICKEKNVDSKKILISGVYKTPEVIKKMAIEDENIGYYTIESMEQFKILKELNKKIKVIIRLTSGNQFGINEDEVEEIIKNRDQYEHLDFKGIQYFSGTQKVSIKNLSRELEYACTVIDNLKQKYNFEAEELEFGPGFPVHYFENTTFDEDSFLNEFKEVLENISYKGKITLELGRSIAASCGCYITKVVDKKTNKGQNYAILDGGIHHLVYYGQSMAMKIPKCQIYPARENENQDKWNLCGSLCTINDILVKQFEVGNLQIGDVFIFKNTGAYCMTEGISLFLSRDLPGVIKIKEDNSLEVARENLATYKLNM